MPELLAFASDIFSYHSLQAQLQVWNSRVTKSSYETELRKMTSRFELQTRKILQKVFF